MDWPTTYTASGGPGARVCQRAQPASACLASSGGADLIASIALPLPFVESALFPSWSGDSQKLYFWLRARINQPAPLAPDLYQQFQVEGFLASYATAETLMEQAVECSRNTLTKLMRELVDREVAQVHPTRPGYVFLLGERVTISLHWHNRPTTVAVYYLDTFLTHSAAAAPVDDATADPPPAHRFES